MRERIQKIQNILLIYLKNHKTVSYSLTIVWGTAMFQQHLIFTHMR